MYIEYEEGKDFKKGQKDAMKTLKKVEKSSTIFDELEEKLYKRTSNTSYIRGYLDILRQEKASFMEAEILAG